MCGSHYMVFMLAIYQALVSEGWNFKFEEKEILIGALDSSIRFVNSISKEFEQTGVRLLIENLFLRQVLRTLCFVR